MEIYVGNIYPSLSKERVVDFLIKNAERNEIADIKVDKIVSLTKVENPRIRSWKLRVPAQLQDYMLSEECYPVNWEFCKGHRSE